MQHPPIRRSTAFLGLYCKLCQGSIHQWMATPSKGLSSAVIDIPVIKVPKRLENKVAKIRKIRAAKGRFTWQGRVFNSRPGKEIISAKRKEYNYYQNQVYGKDTSLKLASHGWKHRKSVGDYFTILAYQGNPSIRGPKLEDQSAHSFEEYGLDPRLLEGLENMDITSPTNIQHSAIPALQRGRNALFAAETGSGKTLAYLLPVLDSLLKIRNDYRNTDVGRPRGIVLVPAQELARQVQDVARRLTVEHGITTEVLEGGEIKGHTERNLREPIDLLIATSGRLIATIKKGLLSLGSVKHAVIDEADTLLDDSFKSSTLHILKKMEINSMPVSLKHSPGSQLILAGATMPKQAFKALEDVVSESMLEVISTPHLHRIQPHINQKFLRLHSQEKAVTLLQILNKEAKRKAVVMIFCNDTPTCNWLALMLGQNGFSCLRLNGGMKMKERRGIMDQFQSGACDILVATDIASRGIDTCMVDLVINFDFPNYMSDYIHRVGRVGRVAGKRGGRVTSFVVHKWDVDLLQKIETAVRTRTSLPRVDANIKRKHILRSTVDENPFDQLLFE